MSSELNSNNESGITTSSGVADSNSDIVVVKPSVEVGSGIEEDYHCKSVKSMIAANTIPQSVGEIILRTVKKCRLWRSERADLTQELITHFLDGLETGKSADELVKTFGDSKQAAKLIRRARLRCRPWWWQTMRKTKQTVYLFILLLVSVYALLFIRFHVGSPVISRDYVALVNKSALSVAAGDRAWPVYREALIGIKQKIDVRSNIPATPEAEGWQDFANKLEGIQAEISLLHKAAGMPGLGFVVGYHNNPADRELWPDSDYSYGGGPGSGSGTASPDQDSMLTMIDVLLPQLTELRFSVRILSADAYRAAIAGDSDTVCADLAGILGIAEHAKETAFIISDLVSVTTVSSASRTTNKILQDYADIFSDEQLAELSDLFKNVNGGKRFKLRFDGERYSFYDLIQHIYTDNGKGNGHLSNKAMYYLQGMSSGGEVAEMVFGEKVLVSAFGPALDMVVADRKEMLREYERLMSLTEKEAAMPLWERAKDGLELEFEKCMASTVMWDTRYILIKVMMPALSRASENADIADMQRDSTVVAIALEQYRRKHGGGDNWPKSLEVLVPEFLDEVPLDRYDGKPLRYKIINRVIVGEDDSVSENKLVLYSLYKDRDDDGGITAEDKRKQLLEAKHNNGEDSGLGESGLWEGGPPPGISPRYLENDGDCVFWEEDGVTAGGGD